MILRKVEFLLKEERMSSIGRFLINYFHSSLISSSHGPYIKIIKENTSNMCASLLQFSMIGFSLCISSRNLIIANFSRCVSETHLTFYFYLNVIAASLAQAPSQFPSMTDIQLTFYVANLITIK
jgi:hypothetical protein